MNNDVQLLRWPGIFVINKLVTVVYDKQTASSQMLTPTSHSMAQTFSQRTKRGRYRSGRHNIPRLNTVLLVLSFFLAGLAIALGSLPRRYNLGIETSRSATGMQLDLSPNLTHTLTPGRRRLRAAWPNFFSGPPAYPCRPRFSARLALPRL